MTLSLPSLTIYIAILTATACAQCVTDGYIPCYPAGSSDLGGVPTDSFDDSSFWASLQDVASSPIGRRDLAHPLAPRQDALCCAPDPNIECLVTTDENIPFCYVGPPDYLYNRLNITRNYIAD